MRRTALASGSTCDSTTLPSSAIAGANVAVGDPSRLWSPVVRLQRRYVVAHDGPAGQPWSSTYSPSVETAIARPRRARNRVSPVAPITYDEPRPLALLAT